MAYPRGRVGDRGSAADGNAPDVTLAGIGGTQTASILEADARTRTGDPFITSEVLYQLSYVGDADLV